MTLIYAYIQKYKNYAEQSILFNMEYNVQFQDLFCAASAKRIISIF